MANIDIRREHRGSLKTAKEAVTRTATALGNKFALNHAWEGNTLRFQRFGVSGTILVTSTEVHVQAQLGFLFAGLKPLIENEIEGQLNKSFG